MLIEDILSMPEMIPVIGVTFGLASMCYGLLKKAVLYQLIAFVALFLVFIYILPMHFDNQTSIHHNSTLNSATLFLMCGIVLTFLTFLIPNKNRLTSFMNSSALLVVLICFNLFLKLVYKEISLSAQNNTKTVVFNQ